MMLKSIEKRFDESSFHVFVKDRAADKITSPDDSMKERRLSLHICLLLSIYITLTHVIILMS